MSRRTKGKGAWPALLALELLHLPDKPAGVVNRHCARTSSQGTASPAGQAGRGRSDVVLIMVGLLRLSPVRGGRIRSTSRSRETRHVPFFAPASARVTRIAADQ